MGCGSLRVGRLLIPYLNRSGYTGFEPNRWLIQEGIARECGADQIENKAPRFVVSESSDIFSADESFDFVLAQSIFSHMGLDLIAGWFDAAARLLAQTGVLVATYLPAKEDFEGEGWIYPDCVSYRSESLEELAQAHGLLFRPIAWRHPRQSWVLIFRPGHRFEALDFSALSWDFGFDAGLWDRTP